jgi:hypothetical protein
MAQDQTPGLRLDVELLNELSQVHSRPVPLAAKETSQLICFSTLRVRRNSFRGTTRRAEKLWQNLDDENPRYSSMFGRMPNR